MFNVYKDGTQFSLEGALRSCSDRVHLAVETAASGAGYCKEQPAEATFSSFTYLLRIFDHDKMDLDKA